MSVHLTGERLQVVETAIALVRASVGKNVTKVAEDKEKSPLRGEEVKMPPATASEVTSSSATAVTTTPASQAAAAAFLAWPPLLLHPWAPALLPGAWCSSAIRSALPGLVKKIFNTFSLRSKDYFTSYRYLPHFYLVL